METLDTPFISKITFKRIVNDVKELIVSPLYSHGIYYIHNENDILKGKALIIGPSDTPYDNGFYLFDFNFPTNYPHSPPEVTFCTNDGLTRMNPNLYIQGKVCLSILNTWQGDQWTGCQTISSVLLALCTLLTSNPLLNEPGVSDTHKDFKNYNTVITYKNFETAMIHVLTNKHIIDNFPMFENVIRTHFLAKFDYNIKRLNELLVLHPVKERINTSIYRMDVRIDYKKLLDNFINLKSLL